MALYAYQAFTKEGKKVQGQVDATSLSGVRDNLIGQSLYPIKIELLQASNTSLQQSFMNYLRPAIGLKEKIFFSKQLSVLLKSGVPLLPALELLIEQSDGRLKDIIIDLKDTIKEGLSLADGLAKYPQVFNSIYIQLVRAGEASGKLEVILERLTQYLIRQAEVRKKIKSALSKPLMNLGLILAMSMGLLIGVIPSLADTLTSIGGDLPAITTFTIALSGFLTRNYLFFIVGIAITTVLFVSWKKTSSGAKQLDIIKLKIPVVSYFTKTGAIIQFSRTLGILLEGGVNIAEALFIVCKIVDNRVLTDALIVARDNIIKQGKIAEYLKQTHMFPAMAIYLINTGEQSGHLDSMLLSVAENYEEELNDYADSLTEKIGPAMMILTMLIVGPMIASIILPLMQSAANMSKM